MEKSKNTDLKNQKEIILAQWQTCVEMASDTSQRRDSMNNIFMSLNIAIMAATAFVWDIKSILLLISGVIVCILWLLLIRNYKLLNTAKFEVINSLEEQLPALPYKSEWNLLKKNKKYCDSTKLEKILPITFICLYGIAIFIILLTK